MEEQKQYQEELLEWCNNIYLNWEMMKPRFSQLFELESLAEWEGTCRQLKEKLQADLRVDFDDYQTAKNLYEQWEQLLTEMIAHQEEGKVDSEQRLEWEEQPHIHDELLETNAYQEEIEVDSDTRLEWEEQQPFHYDLLETNSYQEENEIDSDNRLEFEEQQPFQHELLETNAYQEEVEVDSDQRLEFEVQNQSHEQLLEMDTYQQGIEVETDNSIELEEQLNNVKIYCNGVITFILIGKS